MPKKFSCKCGKDHLSVLCHHRQLPTFTFFLKKHYKSSEIALSHLVTLLDTLEVLTVDRATIEAAIDSGMTDFEDAVQAAAAQDFGIDIIVTRDKTGFGDSGLRVYSPEEFLETLV